jgi:hypothetical protein
MSNSRARVIYQSEALYAGTVDATGYHFTVSGLNSAGYSGVSTQTQAETLAAGGGDWKNGIQQLRRVQSANYSFTINRQDVNQFGQLARIDSVPIDPPTVNLDFSYYLTNGVNEKILGFNVDGQTSALPAEVLLGGSSDSANPDGHNFFILTVPQGQDAVNNSSTATDHNVIALGNGFVTNYSIEAAVGSMPTASVSIEGLNLQSYIGSEDLDTPAINTQFGTPIDGLQFSIPDAISGVTDEPTSDTDEGISCLRPGDISMSLGHGRAGGFELLPSKEPWQDYEGSGSAHIQSFSIDVPISRTTLQRLGNSFGYSKVVDFPVNISVSVSAILSELKAGNVTDILFDKEEHDLIFTMREPDQYGTGDIAMQFRVGAAQLEGESFSSSIGDNKTVDLTFTAQLGGPEDTARGIFISGSRNALNIDQSFA